MDNNIFHEFNGPSKDKCNYYNRTRNRLLITAYEGIPETLLLNALGCVVTLSFIFCIYEEKSMGLWTFSISQ
jgi:hypothetical protein